MNTKVDFINGAYSRMRVSGLTKQPDGADVTLALYRLEMMAAMWLEKNIDTNYAFEDQPDPNTPHNVPLAYWSAFESNLAVNLLADFGKQATPGLVQEATGSLSSLYGATAKVSQILRPNRQPIGNGNSLRYNRWQRYYRNELQIVVDAQINEMDVGDINDFSEHFDAYLDLAETIVSYTIASSQPSKLAISNDAISLNDIIFRATALIADTVSVKIVITTSLGRVETRNVVFRVIEVTDA